MTQRPSRSAVPVELTWDLDSLYPSTAAWEADLKKVDAVLPELESFKGRLGESAETLLACLRKQEQVSQLAGRVLWYAYNRANEDQGDPERSALKARAMALSARASKARSFIQPEILALPDGTVERWLEENQELALYRLYLTDMLARKPHMLGAEAEAVLAQLGELFEAPYDIWQNATTADMKWDPVTDERGELVPMSRGALGKLLQSPDRAVREAAYRSALKAYDAHKRTLTAAIAAAQKRDVILARLRKYSSALEASMAAEHLPTSLFHNLLKVSEEQAAPHYRRYLEYRRCKLGLEKLAPWDLNAPLDADLNPEVTFRDGWEMTVKALEPLGAEYRAVLDRALSERWLDLADNEGKEPNAYSWNCYGYHPVILLVWKDKLGDVFTLAHELGHAAHSVLSDAAQPYIYTGYSSFLAEMASTTNEILLARYLLKSTSDPAMRRYVLTRALDAFHSNFFGGSAMAAIQLELHEMVERGDAITFEAVTHFSLEFQKRRYGDTVEMAPEYATAWLRPLHNFRNFYSYQYATGISAAAAFADAILTEGAPAVERYLGFLRAGSSAHPLDVLKAAGLDMTTPEPIERAVKVYAELVDELVRT